MGETNRQSWTSADRTMGTAVGTASSSGGVAPPQAQLEPGRVLGGRYEIVEKLGEGGMGAVYKARDLEVDRLVALKVIRPDLAGNPTILQRFKQELVLARTVTHRNVIRIYDLNEADGLKFITMEYVEGRDLRSLLRDHGKLSPGQAVDITAQVLAGLQAAHAVGVIHRDLKPGNIMRDAQGRVVVMDFGLARSLDSDGMTQTGMMLGTIDYMSPEQAQAKELDARSDLFTVGLILYELLSGNTPFKAESAIASLLKRSQERAVPLSEVDRTVPRVLSNIVSKCLERDPHKRYQSAQEILNELSGWSGKPMSGATTTVIRVIPRKAWGIWAGVAVVLVLGAMALTWYLVRVPKAAPVTQGQHAPLSVLVADFDNHTGDPIFDGTLEPMFNVALEGASFINAYSRESARKQAQKLPHPTDRLDEQSARLVAVSQAVSAVIAGQITQRGDKYHVSAMALDAVTGNVLASGEVSVANKDEILHEIPKLVAPIRKALGDNTPASVQFEVSSGAFNVASLEAAHQEALGVEQQFAGKFEDAFQSFSKATQLDANFALPYTGMSAMSAALGKRLEAEKYIKLALEHGDRMTERERYRTRGLYYIRMGNWQKCVEEYSQLINRYPADRIGQANLALCYGQLRNLPKAVEAARRAAEIVPKGAIQRLNLSFLSSYGGDFQAGEQEARAALQLSPSAEGYLILAEAQLGQGQLSEAAETYHGLERLSDVGASMASAGLADLAVYEGRFSDAVHLLEKSAAADLASKNPENAANKFAALAHVQLLWDQKRAANAAAEQALAHSQSIQVRFLVGRTFVEAGELPKAEKLATTLASEITAEPQAYAKIIEGDSALKQGDAYKAIKAFTEANNLLDTWVGRLELGRAYLQAGLFVEADSEFDRCIKRRGEALEFFQDNVPTYGYFPAVYYYQGRTREGLKSPAFADSYRTYLSIRGKSGEDPLLAEIRRRLGQ